MVQNMTSLYILAGSLGLCIVNGWAPVLPVTRSFQSQRTLEPRFMADAISDTQPTLDEQQPTTELIPLFDFSNDTAAGSFSRIDDVIMGGVSSSTFVNEPNSRYAKWFGVCRTDGGGFCGVRTLPFEEALPVQDADGIYLRCRLVSDDEPERRVWKMTSRVKPDRGEQLYQARYYFAAGKDEWNTVQIPFSDFKLVRGPRVVPDGPPMNVTGGIYQIGMTMSKFGMGINVTELENFREGFFEYHLQSVGLYKETKQIADDEKPKSESKPVESFIDRVPRVLSEEESKKKQPLILKLIKPILALFFFTEQSQRRKAAMNLLRNQRKMSRVGAIVFGWRNKAKSANWLVASARLASILAIDSFRATLAKTVKLTFLLPGRMLLKVVKLSKKKLVGQS